MSGLPNANHRAKVIKALRRAGFAEERHGKHLIMAHDDGRHTTIPNGTRLNVPTLRGIIKQCGLSQAQFLRLYH